MKTVTYNDRKYYVNGPSGALKEKMDKTSKEYKEHVIFNENEPVYFYHHKNFQEDETYLGDAVGILENIKQPTANQVMRAMIWGLGYPGEKMDYMIKAGGGSKSDSLFSSSLSVMIAHPKTGLDTDVVILKKYGKNIEDVYITEKEVRALYKMCMTPKEVKQHKISQMEGGIYFLVRIMNGHKINVGGSEVLATEAQRQQMVQLVLDNGTAKEIEDSINSKIKYREKDLDVELDERYSSSTTDEYHEITRRQIKVLEELKKELVRK